MRDKCKKCKLPTSCCDCVKTQDRTIRDEEKLAELLKMYNFNEAWIKSDYLEVAEEILNELKQPEEDVGNGGTGGHGFHITHPDCTNPDCHKPDRGGACGKCHEFSTKQPEKQETVEEEKKRLKEEGYSLFPGGIYVKFPENFAENLKISSSCGGSEDCGSTSCSQHSKPEKQEIEIAEEDTFGKAYYKGISENRELIIELQKVVNKLIKESK